MSVAANTGEKGFTEEYLKDGIARLKEEDSKYPTPENDAAIDLAEKDLEDQGE